MCAGASKNIIIIQSYLVGAAEQGWARCSVDGGAAYQYRHALIIRREGVVSEPTYTCTRPLRASRLVICCVNEERGWGGSPRIQNFLLTSVSMEDLATFSNPEGKDSTQCR